MNKVLTPADLIPYIGPGLEFKENGSSRVIVATGYTKGLGFTSGDNDVPIPTAGCKPMLLTIEGLTVENQGNAYGLVKLYAAYTGMDQFKDGKLQAGMTIKFKPNGAGENKAQAVLLCDDTDDPDIAVTFSVTEHRGLMVVGSSKSMPGNMAMFPAADQQKMMQAVYKLGLWFGDQSIFRTGEAIGTMAIPNE